MRKRASGRRTGRRSQRGRRSVGPDGGLRRRDALGRSRRAPGSRSIPPRATVRRRLSGRGPTLHGRRHCCPGRAPAGRPEPRREPTGRPAAPLGPGESVFSRHVERWTGFEPATPRLRAWCSTTELPQPDATLVPSPVREHSAPIAVGEAGAPLAGGIGRLHETRCGHSAAKDAGGSRTHLKPVCSRPPHRRAPASSDVLARSRTWPSTFAESCALRHTPRTLLL